MKHRGFETDAKKVSPTRSTTTLPKRTSPDTQLQNVLESDRIRNFAECCRSMMIYGSICRSGIRRAFWTASVTPVTSGCDLSNCTRACKISHEKLGTIIDPKALKILKRDPVHNCASTILNMLYSTLIHRNVQGGLQRFITSSHFDAWRFRSWSLAPCFQVLLTARMRVVVVHTGHTRFAPRTNSLVASFWSTLSAWEWRIGVECFTLAIINCLFSWTSLIFIAWSRGQRACDGPDKRLWWCMGAILRPCWPGDQEISGVMTYWFLHVESFVQMFRFPSSSWVIGEYWR